MVISPLFPNLSRTSWKYKNGGRVTALFVIGYFFVLTKDDSLRVTKVEKNLIAKEQLYKNLLVQIQMLAYPIKYQEIIIFIQPILSVSLFPSLCILPSLTTSCFLCLEHCPPFPPQLQLS